MTSPPTPASPSLDLRHLMAELNAARALAARGREGRAESPEAQHARRILLDAAHAYVEALESLNLPVPRQVRDEIRLYQRLS